MSKSKHRQILALFLTPKRDETHFSVQHSMWRIPVTRRKVQKILSGWDFIACTPEEDQSHIQLLFAGIPVPVPVPAPPGIAEAAVRAMRAERSVRGAER